MIGRLERTVLDCPDPRALTAFYADILGMRINEDTDGDWQKDPAAPHLSQARGATRLPNEHENGFRMFIGLAGHPFCLVYA